MWKRKRNGSVEGEDLFALGKVSWNDRRRLLEIDTVEGTVMGN